ncbi:MAG: lysophospholipid acyltransferase family protein [Bryobacteraceae bacterium]|nr:lysophospholipid acyltransferase family protein [Bryobacteraceae bacterium]
MLSYWRSVLFTIPLAFATTAILIWTSYLLALFDRRTVDPMFRFWARAVMRVCGARHRARGVETIDTSRSYIVVSNHLSLIDSPLLVNYLPLSIRFLAKKELLKIPVMGGYMTRTGHIPIDRSNPRAALQSMNEAARKLQTSGHSVLIYPEGTRSINGELQEFKDGAAMLALKSGLPLLPVAVVGTNRVLPAKGVVIRSADIELRVGEAVMPEGHTRASLTAELRTRVARLLAS